MTIIHANQSVEVFVGDEAGLAGVDTVEEDPAFSLAEILAHLHF